jgi:hypothetical protein
MNDRSGVWKAVEQAGVFMQQFERSVEINVEYPIMLLAQLSDDVWEHAKKHPYILYHELL